MTAIPVEPPADLHGSDLEIGRGQGAAFAARIVAARARLRDMEAFATRRPWWAPWPLYLRLAERRAARALAAPLRRDWPEVAERIAGIAAGASLREPTLWLLNTLESLMSSVRSETTDARMPGAPAAAPATILPPPGACSAIAVGARRAAGGEAFVARNLDYLLLGQPFQVLRRTRPSHGYCALEFTFAALAGCVDGVNEKGLAIAYDYAFTVDRGAPGATLAMVVSDALRHCATVDEAADRVLARPRWGSGLLVLADATGTIGAVELSSTRGARRVAGGDDLLFHTNHYLVPAMEGVQVGHEALFTAVAPHALAGHRVLESSEARLSRLRELLAPRARVSPDDAVAILADHGPRGEPGGFTPCVHGPYWNTTACVLLFPRARRMRVAFAPACEAQLVEFAV